MELWGGWKWFTVEIAHLRALRRRRGRPAPTELERGTCDDPIVLDPPGKFQCIVEAAIF